MPLITVVSSRWSCSIRGSSLHINVLPPDGRVRVSAPASLSQTTSEWPWSDIAAVDPAATGPLSGAATSEQAQMCSGETHYLWGRGYRLEVIPVEGAHSVKLQGGGSGCGFPLIMTPRSEAFATGLVSPIATPAVADIDGQVAGLAQRHPLRLSVSNG